MLPLGAVIALSAAAGGIVAWAVAKVVAEVVGIPADSEPAAGRRMAIWRRAAQAAGLSRFEESRTSLTGCTRQLDVRLSRYSGRGEHGSRITISGPGLCRELVVWPDPLLAASRVERDLPTGDERFDRVARVEGPPALARAVLDAETRRALKALLEGTLEQPGRATFWASGQLTREGLRVDVPEVPPRSVADQAQSFEQSSQSTFFENGKHAVAGDRLPEVLQRVLALARRLATPADVPRRLAENLRAEPEASVRLQLLTTLEREFPDLPLTHEVLLAACGDPDAPVRLHAGIALGPEGTDVLVHLADGEGADDDTTRRAVTALGDRLTVDQAVAILHGALRTRRLATAGACITVLGSRGGAEGAAMLRRVLAVETPALAAAAAEALGESGDPSSERALLDALDHADAGVRVAAVQALGRVGTVDAISRLKQAEKDDSSVRSAARQAVAAIQSRLPGAAPGQLSLAGGGSGALSLATDEAGRLSLEAERR